jgi:chromosome segregation ATPase
MAASQDAELSSLKDSLWQLNQQVKDLKRRLEEKDGILATKDATISELTEKSTALNMEVEKLKRDIIGRETKLSTYEKTISEFEEGRRTLTEELERYKNEATLRAAEADEYKQMAASQDAELSSLKNMWWQLNQQVKDLKRRLEEKDGILATKDATISELTEKSTALAAEINRLRREVGERAKEPSEEIEPVEIPPEKPPSVEEKDRLAKKVEELEAMVRMLSKGKSAEEGRKEDLKEIEKKLKFLEIQKRSLVKLLDGLEDKNSFKAKNYRAKIEDITKKITELEKKKSG